MHHLTKKSIAMTFAVLLQQGKSEEEVKAAIKADERKPTDVEVEEIYKIILSMPPAPENKSDADKDNTPDNKNDNQDDDEEEEEEEDIPVVVENKKQPNKPQKKATGGKSHDFTGSQSATAKSKDVISNIKGVVLVDKRNYPEGVPLPDVLANPPVNERGYVICSEYKGEVRVDDNKRKVWRKTLRIRANVKLTPAIFHKENGRCDSGHPYMYLPEILSEDTIKSEADFFNV